MAQRVSNEGFPLFLSSSEMVDLDTPAARASADADMLRRNLQSWSFTATDWREVMRALVRGGSLRVGRRGYDDSEAFFSNCRSERSLASRSPDCRAAASPLLRCPHHDGPRPRAERRAPQGVAASHGRRELTGRMPTGAESRRRADLSHAASATSHNLATRSRERVSLIAHAGRSIHKGPGRSVERTVDERRITDPWAHAQPRVRRSSRKGSYDGPIPAISRDTQP